ncbi:aspartate/glutamate racemase family protein [Streptomyces sp. NBC_00057]|uniref:aspartate/glutamate racemase family protein n=1 Tax=Streptomyces sp. NBC_00057 TaxID=2975634 RepID=UPI00324AC1EC
MAAVMGDRGVLGVLGGMGPLASAEFIKNIYAQRRVDREQDMPRILLDSDPMFPDRTRAIRSGVDDYLKERLCARLAGLTRQGATTTVVTCFTAHHFLPEVEPVLRRNLVSLVDVTLDGLVSAPGRFLLLCTSGSREARIFQNAPSWPAVESQIVLPDSRDQELVHQMVYRMKLHGPMPGIVPTIDLLVQRYDCTGVVCGCTEFHLVSGALAARYGEANVIDALRSIVIGLPELLGDRRSHSGPEHATTR